MTVHQMTFPDCLKTIARTGCSNENPIADCSNPTSALKIMDMSTFYIQLISKVPAFEQTVRPCKMNSRYIHRMPFNGLSFRSICPFHSHFPGSKFSKAHFRAGPSFSLISIVRMAYTPHLWSSSNLE